jgi:hypothetical protein
MRSYWPNRVITLSFTRCSLKNNRKWPDNLSFHLKKLVNCR